MRKGILVRDALSCSLWKGKMTIYSVRSAAKVLGMTQNAMTIYGTRYKIGTQPGGFGTLWLFTLDDLKKEN